MPSLTPFVSDFTLLSQVTRQSKQQWTAGRLIGSGASGHGDIARLLRGKMKEMDYDIPDYNRITAHLPNQPIETTGVETWLLSQGVAIKDLWKEVDTKVKGRDRDDRFEGTLRSSHNYDTTTANHSYHQQSQPRAENNSCYFCIDGWNQAKRRTVQPYGYQRGGMVQRTGIKPLSDTYLALALEYSAACAIKHSMSARPFRDNFMANIDKRMNAAVWNDLPYGEAENGASADIGKRISSHQELIAIMSSFKAKKDPRKEQAYWQAVELISTQKLKGIDLVRELADRVPECVVWKILLKQLESLKDVDISSAIDDNDYATKGNSSFARILTNSLDMVKKEFSSQIQTHGLDRVLQLYYVPNQRDNAEDIEQNECWGRAFLSYRAGNIAEMKQIVEDRDRPNSSLLQPIPELEESIAKYNAKKLNNRWEFGNVFMDQLFFALSGQPKYCQQLLNDLRRLDFVWVLLRNVGVFVANDEDMRRFLELREELIATYRTLTVSQNQLKNLLYLAAYAQVLSRPGPLLNKEDYLHLLLALRANKHILIGSDGSQTTQKARVPKNPFGLDRKSAQQPAPNLEKVKHASDFSLFQDRLNQLLLTYIDELLTCSNNNFIYYMLMLPQDIIPSQLSSLIAGADLLDHPTMWKILRQHLSPQCYKNLVTSTLECCERSGWDLVKAAEAYWNLAQDSKKAIEVLIKAAVKVIGIESQVKPWERERNNRQQQELGMKPSKKANRPNEQPSVAHQNKPTASTMIATFELANHLMSLDPQLKALHELSFELIRDCLDLEGWINRREVSKIETFMECLAQKRYILRPNEVTFNQALNLDKGDSRALRTNLAEQLPYMRDQQPLPPIIYLKFLVYVIQSYDLLQQAISLKIVGNSSFFADKGLSLNFWGRFSAPSSNQVNNNPLAALKKTIASIMEPARQAMISNRTMKTVAKSVWADKIRANRSSYMVAEQVDEMGEWNK